MNVWVELKKPRHITMGQIAHILQSHGVKGTGEILYLLHAFAHADLILCGVLIVLIASEAVSLFVHWKG